MNEYTNTDQVVNAIRYAVKARGYWAKFATENNITRDQIADTARDLAALAYPTDEPVQSVGGKRTRFGNAVQAAGKGLREALADDSDDSDDSEKVTNLLTRAGVNATLAEVTAAWKAAQK